MVKSIIKWMFAMLAMLASIIVIAILATMALLYASMYMVVAMVQYGTQPVLITVAGAIAFILLIIAIRMIIKRRKKVYRWR